MAIGKESGQNQQVAAFEIKGNLLARNTILNFVGQVLPLIVGVVSMPFVVRGLGSERFGILSLAWGILGYFGLFDFGLGRATTKFIAEALGSNEVEKVPHIVWITFFFQVAFGLIGGLIFIAIIPFLVDRVFNIPPEMIKEAKNVFLLMAISAPIVLASGTFLGVLSAAQRFDLLNAVKIPSSSMTYLIPALMLAFKSNLQTIVLILVLSKFVTGVVYLCLCFEVFPILRHKFPFSTGLVRTLFTFGGWVTLTNISYPIFTSLDRYLIGFLQTMSAVAYYTAPQEIVSRLSLLPASLIATVFPAASTLWGKKANRDLERLYARSLKYILLLMGPLVLLLILLSPVILKVWLGTHFVKNSSFVFQILLIGVFVSSLAQVPYSFLHGIGRPDITAKFHLLEMPIYVGLAYFLIKNMGINGAALAWSIRVAFDALLLFSKTLQINLISRATLIQNGLLRSLSALSVFAALSLLAIFVNVTIPIRVAFISLGIFCFVTLTWSYALDSTDRAVLGRFINALTGSTKAVK